MIFGERSCSGELAARERGEPMEAALESINRNGLVALDTSIR
jgi:hypothetical protein